MQEAHRIAWIIENKCEIPEDKPYILHSCNNPKCCNPNHLRAGTHRRIWMTKLMQTDKHAESKLVRGKLTDQQVIEIYLSTESTTALAKKYTVE